MWKAGGNVIEKLYTVEEVAELASVTGRTIRNYLKSGRLVGRKIGGQWRFPETEVQRLLSGALPEPFVPETAALPHAPEYADYEATPPDSAYDAGDEYQPVAASAPVYAPSVSPPVYETLPPQAAEPVPAFMFPPAPVQAAPPPSTYSAPMYYAPPPAAPAQPPLAPPAAEPVLPYAMTVQPTLPTPMPPPPPRGAYYNAPPPAPMASPAPVLPVPEAPAPPPPAASPENDTLHELVSGFSEVGLKVAHFVAEVHDASDGPVLCAVVDANQPLAAARMNSERLSEIAEEESAQGALCQCFVEYDDRYFVARYTLLGTSGYLLRGITLIG
jgi:excisionase family DNA binding protein